jgi:hypothetical protein
MGRRLVWGFLFGRWRFGMMGILSFLGWEMTIGAEVGGR